MFRYIFLAYNLNKLTHRVALTISSESFLPNHLFLTLSKLLKLVQSLTFHNVLLSFEEILNGNINLMREKASPKHPTTRILKKQKEHEKTEKKHGEKFKNLKNRLKKSEHTFFV